MYTKQTPPDAIICTSAGFFSGIIYTLGPFGFLKLVKDFGLVGVEFDACGITIGSIQAILECAAIFFVGVTEGTQSPLVQFCHIDFNGDFYASKLFTVNSHMTEVTCFQSAA